MLRPWRGALLAVFLLCFAGSISAQDAGVSRSARSGVDPVTGARVFHIQVRDSGGMPLNGAVAVIGDIWVEQADSHGVIRFDTRPSLHLPAIVQVRARGYKPRSVLWDGTEKNTEVYLDADEAVSSAPSGGSKTVSVAELNPEHQRASRRLQQEAIEALAQNENQKAEQLLRKAIVLTPSVAGIQNNLGVALLRQRKFEEAAPYFEKAYEMRPLDASASGNLGLVRWMQGRPDECYMLLDRAVALGFSAPTANYYLGILALSKSRWKQAIEQLDRTNPERFPYRDLYRSYALRALGEERQASQTFLQFIRRMPATLFRFAWILGRSEDETGSLALGYK